MKKKLKKGFTLVELVIVIAVIAILSAVLIPTFGNVIERANNSAAMSEVSNAINQYTTNQASNSQSADLFDGYIVLLKKEAVVNGNSAAAAYGTTGNEGAITSNNISYVFSYNKGKLDMVDFTYVSSDNTNGLKLSGVKSKEDSSAAGVQVTLKINGLTTTDGSKTWTAEGTVVLDGTLTGTELKGKVMLLQVLPQQQPEGQ